MKARVFIKQQESLNPPPAPEPLMEFEPMKKKRGRKKSHVTLNLYLFHRKIFLLRWYLRKKKSRRLFARYMGMKRWKYILLSGFRSDCRKDQDKFNDNQQRYDTRFAKPKNITAVPLLKAKNILKGDFEVPPPLYKAEPVFIPKMPVFEGQLQYFAFTMPDNCMVNDGICKGDRIVAIRNIKPSHRDMVVCKLPGISTVTVRRFTVSINPGLYYLYEGGTINPLPIYDTLDLIIGVVVNIQRNFYPGKLPREWEFEEYLNEIRQNPETAPEMPGSDMVPEDADEVQEQ